MNYAKIDDEEVINGQGIGVSLFVQGCHFHCDGCFNSDTWDFEGGQKWSHSVKKKFMQLLERPYITRVSILGGEPLADENLCDVFALLQEIKVKYAESKTIWLYTGYKFEDFFVPNQNSYVNNFNTTFLRKASLHYIDVLVDGQFEKEKLDLSYPFAGSTNQRVIDVQKSSEKGDIVLWKV